MRTRKAIRPTCRARSTGPEPCRACVPGRKARRRLLGGLLFTAVMAACVPDAPDGGLPTHPGDRFSVTLAWDAPATDAMGDSLDDLAGFRLYYSLATPANGPEGTLVEVGEATEHTVGGLEAGTYYFGVTAVDEAGNESALSDELQVEVGGP